MTLEQLAVFVAVAERQHVTQAAKSLGLAQSAVSGAVAALEARHGVRLFHRVGRGIELTEIGRQFLPEARAVIARATAAERALAELAGLERGVLAVHASQTIAGYWLPRHLAAFRRSHPGIAIALHIGNTAQVARSVHDGAAALGFVEGAVDDPALTSTPVARDRMMLVVAPDHPWARRTCITPAMLPDSDWVLREPGSGTRSVFEAALSGFGLGVGALTVALELPSNEAVRAAVEAGLGATVMSASVAVPSLEAGLLHEVGLPLPDRSFHVLRHRERHESPAASALLALIARSGHTAGVPGD
jgi:DNA-binding transcriptional LysR family regulator